MQIPIDNLSEDALKKIVEEFILREGTDYGSIEFSLETKAAQVIKQLKRGDAAVVFDEKTETIDIVPKRSLNE